MVKYVLLKSYIGKRVGSDLAFISITNFDSVLIVLTNSSLS